MDQNSKDWFDGIIGYEDKKEFFAKAIEEFNEEGDEKKAEKTDTKDYFFFYYLLNGEPGLGKSLFATKIAQALKGNHYTLFHDEKDHRLIQKVNKVFKEALQNQPSVIVLDDLDKFFSDDDSDCDFGIIQAKLDELISKKARVFVLATTNSIESFPKSLLRSGRFEVVDFQSPDPDSCKQLLSYYIQGKKLDKEVDFQLLSDLVYPRNCAEIEAIAQKACLFAKHKGESTLHLSDFIQAYLQVVLNVNGFSKPKPNAFYRGVAYHEVAHAFVSSYYMEDSVLLVSLVANSSRAGSTCIKANESSTKSFNELLTPIRSALAGKIVSEVFFNQYGLGAKSDLEKAFRQACSLFQDHLLYGYRNFQSDQGFLLDSLALRIHDGAATLLQHLDKEVRLILFKNRPILDNLVEKLLANQFLYQKDFIAASREAHKKN